MATFPVGQCSLGNNCLAPTHELRKWCPGCNGLIHVICSQVLEDDEGFLKLIPLSAPSEILRKNRSQFCSQMVRAYCYICFLLHLCFLINYLVLLLHCDQQNNSNRSWHKRENSRKEWGKVASGRILQSLLQENQQMVIEMKE
jgi:hypothetical protein